MINGVGEELTQRLTLPPSEDRGGECGCSFPEKIHDLELFMLDKD